MSGKPLTPREQQLLTYLLSSAPDARFIALELDLATTSIKTMTGKLLAKLNATSRQELMGRRIVELEKRVMELETLLRSDGFNG